jgi:serine protease AprX
MMRYAIYNVTEEYIRSIGGTNLKSGKAIAMIFANLTEEQAARMKQDGVVLSLVGDVSTVVHPVIPIPGISVYSPSQLFDYIGLASLRTITNPPLFGKNLNVAIIDTGIRSTHQKVIGHIVYEYNFTTDPMGDAYDHGTAICGIIAELAPQAGILNLKVLDSNGYGTEEEVALAIDHCLNLVDQGSPLAPAVINLSCGTPDLNDSNSPLRLACRQAIADGILVIAACGNSGPANTTIMSPACEQFVIAVGSCSVDSHEVSYFSSRGPTLAGLIKPDCVLFGENVIVASSQSDTAVLSKSGTSFSAPIGSVMALLAQEGIIRIVQYTGGVPLGLKPQAVSSTLNDGTLLTKWIPKVTVKPAGVSADKDNDYGYGLPFGQLITATIQQLNPSSISGLIGPMLMIGLMGMMMKSMGNMNFGSKKNKPEKALVVAK